MLQSVSTNQVVAEGDPSIHWCRLTHAFMELSACLKAVMCVSRAVRDRLCG